MDFSSLVNQLPSLDWTLWRLTGVWAQEGEMVSCPLPGHQDDTPSFNLWEGDDGMIRFGCFGCGRRGNVLDLIDWIEKLADDTDAILRRAGELAQEEAADPEVHERVKPVEAQGRHLPTVLEELHQAFGTHELGVLQRFMAAKKMTGAGEEFVLYLMDEWEWTAGLHRAVAIPHRDRESNLTAIRYRTPDRKWHETGGKFTSLYGAWRDKGHGRVVLCEGESDTVWTAYALQGEEIDVFGMPSGAGQTIRDEWLDQLKDRDLVLMLDQDEPGTNASQRWMAERPDAQLTRLPEDEDVLSSGIPVRELLDRATVPRRDGGMITAVPGVFAKQSANAVTPIADFAFDPVRELFTDEGPAWEVRLSGDRETVIIRASDMHSNPSITRWANRHGRSWIGTGPVVQGVFNWLAAQSAYLPLVRATTKAGKIGRSFVGPGFCIGPDKMRYIPPALGDPKLAARLHIEPGSFDPVAVLALEQLNDPAVMATMLGWLCASLMRGQRAPAPPMFVSGESGAGKTQLLATFLGAFGFPSEVNLTTTTPYGVDCMVNSCVGFPVWFDEYRGGAREDSMMRLTQLMRDAYDGAPSTKGGMTQQATELTEVTTWAAIIASGEMSSRETSIRDRAVMIDLDPDVKNSKAYHWLKDRSRTAGLGHALLAFLADREDGLFKPVPLGDTDLPERYRQTLGFVSAGWDAWKEFRWRIGGHTDAPAAPDFAELGRERAANEDPWLEAIKACEGVFTRDNSSPIVSKKDDGSVVLIPAEVIIEAKRVGIILPARGTELVTWLKRRYDVEATRVDKRRAWKVTGLEL